MITKVKPWGRKDQHFIDIEIASEWKKCKFCKSKTPHSEILFIGNAKFFNCCCIEIAEYSIDKIGSINLSLYNEIKEALKESLSVTFNKK